MSGKCFDYGTYGECTRSNCGYSHNLKDKERKTFFIAYISNICKNGTIVLRKLNQNKHEIKKEFNIGKEPWKRNGAAQGDLIVFQTSIEQLQLSQSRGKVFTVLSKACSLSVLHKNIAIKESAFTLDPIAARYYDDALTIEDCKDKDHSGCKQIGIHIAVASNLQKISVNDLSFYSKIKSSSKFKRNINNLEKGKYRLTVSVYLHTAATAHSDSVTKPEFSIVKVTDNFSISLDLEKYKPLILPAWSHFSSLANIEIAQTGACKYLSSTPKIWREFFILDKLMATFGLGVRKLIEKTKFQAHFISASDPVYQKKITDHIYVPEKYLDDALACLVDDKKYNDLDILPLVAAGRMSLWMDLPADSMRLGYERDVVICSNLNTECVIKCTSPMRKMQHYLNQQVLIHSMINPESELYKKKELLGILGIRFRTPKMLLAIVKTIDETSFTVNYNDNQSINPEICKIDYATLCDEYKKEEGKLTIHLEKIDWDKKHYCRPIVSCDGEPFEKLIEEFRGERNFTKMHQHLQRMKVSKNIQVSTYTNANDGTMINLQLGSELQLQISNVDAGEKNGLGLRLLRISRNCHLCLLHMNHPELAFMSDRKDIRAQKLENRIKTVTEMTTDEKLNTIQLKNVNIKWCDDYFSGGNFSRTGTILPGDFLCIRKEIISGNNREDVKYVWNAHGIVVTNIKKNVKFSVCTLSQAEKPESDEEVCTSSQANKPILDEEGFCVDIISTGSSN